MPRKLLLATLLSAVGLLSAAPAQASDHLMTVNEVETIFDGDSGAEFIELRDPFDEPFPNPPYELQLYNSLGVEIAEEPISQAGLQATNTTPYLLATVAAETAHSVTADEALDMSLPGSGQLCFTRTNAETKIYCMAWGCITNVVSGAQAGPTVRAPPPNQSSSAQLQSGGNYTRGTPTPNATNVAGTAAPNCDGPQTFTVDQTNDEADLNVGDGVCDADVLSGNQCSLRSAIQEANVSSSNDTIAFAASFNGEAADAVSLSSSLPTVVEEATIDGGDCDPSANSKPCAAIDANNTTFGLSVGADGVDIRGIALYDAINPLIGGNGVTVKGSWFGIGLDGSGQGSSTALLVEGDGAMIGGTAAADRNLFGSSNTGLVLSHADDARVRGNHFGLAPDGDTPLPNADAIRIQGTVTPLDDATGNVIGATMSSSAAATTTCDGGCNVIVGSPSKGINLGADTGSTTAAEDTTIKGNFIGLLPAGTVDEENQTGIDVGDAKGVLIGGTGSADRNFISGGTSGIRDEFSYDSRGLEIKRNFVGLTSSGALPVNPPTAGILVFSDSATPDLVSRNRLAGDAGTFPAIGVGGSDARVVRNKVGLGKNGENVGGGFVGIQVTGRNAIIGEPEAGNTVGNVIGPNGVAILIEANDPGGFADTGDLNRVQANFIGVDSAGVARPNAGTGVVIQDTSGGTPQDNLIGGGSSATENVISNSTSNDAILIRDNGTPPQENLIKRNRGKNNGAGSNDLFIDLGSDGPGNPSPVLQDGIDAPVLDEAQTSRTATKGTCVAGATVYIFRTTGADNESPKRINGFVKVLTDSNNDGNFSTSFSQIPSGQRLTALQINPNGSSSELALAVTP